MVETDTKLTYPKMKHFLFAKLCVTAHEHVHINLRVRLCVSVSICVCAYSRAFLSFILQPKSRRLHAGSLCLQSKPALAFLLPIKWLSLILGLCGFVVTSFSLFL